MDQSDTREWSASPAGGGVQLEAPGPLQASHLLVEDEFNPEVGFIRRSNNRRYNGTASWNPIIDSSDVIRTLTFGTSVDYYETAGTGEIETRGTGLNLGVDFDNNAAISLAATENFDRLVERVNAITQSNR